jgi:hypothetical protein
MRIRHVLAALLMLAGLSSIAQQPIDLHAAVKEGRIVVFNRELSLIDEPAHHGIRLSKAYGEGIAWLYDVEFSNGEIEFDVRGEDLKQHSFVGIAFHGANDTTFDAIYLRPFQFLKKDPVLHARSIQYIALPTYSWRRLRATDPGAYEHAIDPPPDPNGWVHMRVVVDGDTITTTINGAAQPALVVRKLPTQRTGRVGFYVADTSGGEFANIVIVPAK